MDFNDDEHLDVCQNIEAGLKQLYERHADLTDAICLFALENAKIAIRKHCGFARNEKVTGRTCRTMVECLSSTRGTESFSTTFSK